LTYDELDHYLETHSIIPSAYALAKQQRRHISTVTSRLKAKGYVKGLDGSWRSQSKKPLPTSQELLNGLTKHLDRFKVVPPTSAELTFLRSSLEELLERVEDLSYGETSDTFD